MEKKYEDRYSPKIEGLLTSRICAVPGNKEFKLALSGRLTKDRQYEYRITLPYGFSEDHKIKGTLDEMLPEFDRLIDLYIENYDEEIEAQKQRSREIYAERVVRTFGRENR